jgi:hypothetical protein
MNNTSTQGEWEKTLLLPLMQEIDYVNAGFNEIDLSIIGILEDLDRTPDDEADLIIKQFEEMKTIDRQRNTKEHIENPDKKDYKDVKKEFENKISETREDYFVMSFDNIENKERFLKRFQFDPDTRYVKGEVLEKMINKVTA